MNLFIKICLDYYQIMITKTENMFLCQGVVEK